MPAAQQGGIREYLDFWGRSLAEGMRVLPYEELPGLRRREPGTYVLSALDQLGSAMTRLIAALHRTEYLEPARPALERIAGRTLPWLARLARWRNPHE